MKDKQIKKGLSVLLFIILLCSALTYAQNDQDCSGFRTETQGGWGAVPQGDNPGVYLHANFAGAFPSGLVVGCNGGFTLTLTSAQAITDFAPSGTTPVALTANVVDPGGSYDNVFGGQVVTLALNVGFDNYDPDFGSSPLHLQDLYITSGPFQGWTVAQLLAEAEKALGGCGSSYSFSDLNDAVDAVNNNFDDGQVNGGFLICTCIAPSCEISGKTTICKGETTSLCAPAGKDYQYSWSNGQTTSCITVNASDTYSVTVTNALGCSSTCSVPVTVNPLPEVTITPDGSTSICEGNSVQLCASSGSSYIWSPGGQTDKCITAWNPCRYTVRVTNQYGCSDTASLKISVSLPPIVMVTTEDGNCKTNGGSACAQVSGGTGGYSYIWNTGGTSVCIYNLPAGSYTVTVTDDNKCTASNSGKVEVAPDLTVSCSADTLAQTLTANPAGGTGAYSYSWNTSPVQTTQTINITHPGTYIVIVTDEAGCTASCSSTFVSDLVGCTLGFWKNHTRIWKDANGDIPACMAAAIVALGPPYSGSGTVNSSFASTFGLNSAQMSAAGYSQSLTLLQALNLGGGGFNKLARQGVAAFLDGCSINYQYTSSQVLLMMHNAIVSFTPEPAATLFANSNETQPDQCPSGGRATKRLTDDILADGDNIYINAFPNPFSQVTTIEILSAVDYDAASVELFAANGQKLSVLYSGPVVAGETYQFKINAADLSAGVYIYSFKADDEIQYGRVILIK